MNFFPSFIDPTENELSLKEFIDEDRWHRIEYRDVSPGDRIITVRMNNGVRSLSESVVHKYSESLGAWVNGLGSPVVSILDIHIFRAGEPRDDQSREDRQMLLGG